jgi:hypothetical protein
MFPRASRNSRKEISSAVGGAEGSGRGDPDCVCDGDLAIPFYIMNGWKRELLFEKIMRAHNFGNRI